MGTGSYETFSGDTSTLKPGNLVAVNLIKYKEWPQIGEVICSDQDTVTLAWYDGLYSTPWIKVKLKHGGEHCDWIETLSMQGSNHHPKYQPHCWTQAKEGCC